MAAIDNNSSDCAKLSQQPPCPVEQVEQTAKRPLSDTADGNDHIKPSKFHPSKRKRTVEETHQPPKAREEMTTEELRAMLKRQVEYYLSDINMSRDAFFQERIREAAQKGKTNSLNLTHVLNSPRICALRATKEEVLDALTDSCELTLNTDSDGDVWLVRNTPLPPLRQREKNNKRKEESAGGRDPHAVGCLVKISNIGSPGVQWYHVKDSLREKLPDKVQIRFVSRVDMKRECTVWLDSFRGDRDFFKEPVIIKLEGSDVPVSLLTPGECRACMADLPPWVRVSREKELRQYRIQLAALPLSISGTDFNSVDHLQKCMSDLLEKTEAGTRLKPDSVAEKAVLSLLSYHPNSLNKRGGSDKTTYGIKVDAHPVASAGAKSKCFFVLRRHNETNDEDEEDFSLSKCIWELSRNPPVKKDAMEAFLQQRYDSAAAAFDASMHRLQKRRAAEAEAAAATALSDAAAATALSDAAAATAPSDAAAATAPSDAAEADVACNSEAIVDSQANQS